MQLILKRENNGRALFAKLEMTPEEHKIIRKTDPGKTLIIQDDPGSARGRWLVSLFFGAILALIVGMIFYFLIFSIFSPLVMLLAWFPLSKLVYSQLRRDVTVQDLITGRSIKCKNLQILAHYENTITEEAKKISQFIEYEKSPSTSDVRTIDLN